MNRRCVRRILVLYQTRNKVDSDVHVQGKSPGYYTAKRADGMIEIRLDSARDGKTSGI